MKAGCWSLSIPWSRKLTFEQVNFLSLFFLLSLFKRLIYFTHVSVLSACMYLHYMRAMSTEAEEGIWRFGTGSWVVVSHHADAGNRIGVLYKSNKCGAISLVPELAILFFLKFITQECWDKWSLIGRCFLKTLHAFFSSSSHSSMRQTLLWFTCNLWMCKLMERKFEVSEETSWDLEQNNLLILSTCSLSYQCLWLAFLLESIPRHRKLLYVIHVRVWKKSHLKIYFLIFFSVVE